MIKTKAVIEIELNGHTYRMDCPNDAPIGAVHDALCIMKAYVVRKMQEIDKHESDQRAPSEVNNGN